jgi:hypothetical protein
MKQLLKKIPITIWTIVLISICSIIIFKGLINPNSDKLETISKILTILGIYYLAIQVKQQTRTNQISNEYLNQSNFKFKGFCVNELKNAQPCLCSEPGSLNYNQCSDTHWFNITQIGKLPAKDLKMTLIHDYEKKDISELIGRRTQDEPMLYENDEHQFKLPQHSIPLNLLNLKENGKFLILIEYISLYTNIKYKRIYELGYSPALEPTAIPKSWVKSIRYYNLCLIHINDSETQTWSEVLKNFWYKFLKKIGSKKTHDIHDWLIDL